MALIGVLCAVHPRSDLPARPKASLQAGGISLVERALRQLQAIGAMRVFVLVEREGGMIPPPLPTKWRDMEITLVSRALDLVTHIDDADQVLVIEEGVLVDGRLIEAAQSNLSRQALVVWAANSRNGVRATRIDPTYSFASVLKTSGYIVRTIAKGLGDWDLEQTLIRQVAAQVDTVLLPVDGIITYDKDLCRVDPILWQPISSVADEEVVTDELIAASQKACLDWPAAFIYAPLHKVILKLLVSYNLRGIYITFGMYMLGMAATGLFMTGRLRLAFVISLMFSLLIGMDDAMSKVRTESLRWKQHHDIVVKTIEYSWYSALAYNLSWVNGTATPWALAVIIVIVSVSRDYLATLFREMTGSTRAELDVTSRHSKLVEASLNVNIWTLLPFAVLEYWYAGLLFLSVYGTITFFWAQFRLLIGVRAFLKG